MARYTRIVLLAGTPPAGPPHYAASVRIGQWDYRDPDNRPKNQIGPIDHTNLQVKNYRVFPGYYRGKTRKSGLYSPSAAWQFSPWNKCSGTQCKHGSRVVKALNEKSIGLHRRRFESCPTRLDNFLPKSQLSC